MDQKFKQKLKQLANFTRKAQLQTGVLRSKIPLLEPKTYKTIEKLYIHSREALMDIESVLEDLINENYE